MSIQQRSRWDNVDKALSVTLKLLALSLFVLAVLVLSFCSDDSVKQTSTWTLGRLELVGLQPTKFSLLGAEFETAAAAATGTEDSDAKGLSADLHTIADAEGALRGGRARHGRSPNQCLRRGDELVAVARQASRPWLQDQQQLHRHRLPAHVQAHAPAREPVRFASASATRVLRSTRNDMAPHYSAPHPGSQATTPKARARRNLSYSRNRCARRATR